MSGGRLITISLQHLHACSTNTHILTRDTWWVEGVCINVVSNPIPSMDTHAISKVACYLCLPVAINFLEMGKLLLAKN